MSLFEIKETQENLNSEGMLLFDNTGFLYCMFDKVSSLLNN
jgi:hypothetical protein